MADDFDLDSPAKQTVFAKLVGVSQPTIASHLNKGRLTVDGSYRLWLTQYCEHLRGEAAGRGGSQQEELTSARIEESRVKAANGRLDYLSKRGELIPRQWVGSVLTDWAGFANREYLAGIREMVAEIKSNFKVDVDDEMVIERAGAIVGRIRDHAEHAIRSLDDSSK